MPGAESFDEARRVFYGSFDRRPAVIVRPADATDVAKVIAAAAATELELAVRSGGHSPAGHGTTEGGILLDLSAMTALDLNPTERIAWAEAGLTAGQYTDAAGAVGLATPFGDTGSVGIGGLTLGGGIGYLVRKHGLTLDNLLAADLVTADGSLIRVTNETDPELFWAIRGGGGNFGVATRFCFKLHPVEMIVGGMLVLPATADVITKIIDEAEAAADELSIIANVMVAPEMPGLSAEDLGRPIVMLLLAYAGDLEDGGKAVAPFRALASPLVDMVGPLRYPEIYQFTEGGPPPQEEAAWSFFLDDFDVDQAGSIIDHLHQTSAPIAVAQLRVLGGAYARVPVDATAFAHRERRLIAAVGTVFDDPAESEVHRDWVKRLSASLHRGESGVYVGFMGDEGGQRVREAYPPSTWRRLEAIKAKYDPTNLFRLNQNVPPG
ncbi:MAG TPA: FAD-binding oxidoreductase [Acidimicrobiia bacterium]|nr:FAD-binding oxidoreductase [Acidimicrobiia bacterium]